MKKILLIIPFIALLNIKWLSSQLYFSLPEEGTRNITVADHTKKIFKYPWAGGINAAQFGEIDLNLDGIKDIVVFDRIGNRLMTFINEGLPGEISYSFAPEYSSSFPIVKEWIILKDYNNDGKNDIFTYAQDFPGIIVYKNISQQDLSFELEVYPYLTSLQGGGQVNILTTNVDYPGIEDIDNDGDMDILTFWGLGSFIEYHQNQSMELYGIPDSLEFIEVSQCWGEFAESDESNLITLDTCLINQNSGSIVNERTRHTGSTFLLIDLDADNDKDLLLGDVDYPNLIELINGGDVAEAVMISQDGEFPSYNKSLNLFSMPVAAYLDVNNDLSRDLILSPFDPNPFIPENKNSVWLYLNEGLTNSPDFDFTQKNFVQEDMIDVGSGAYPILFDYNMDGLTDIFISNYGYYMYSYYSPGMFLHSVYWSNIALFENTGTIEVPSFSQVTHDFADLHKYHLRGIYPSFGDIDGDEDIDMIFGNEDGSLALLENTSGNPSVMEFNEPLFSYKNLDVGNFSTPQLFDLNKDGLLDLIIGEEDGNLNYYENSGSATNAEFVFITDSLGKVDVRAPEITYTFTGYSAPCFFYNDVNEIELLVGSEQGKVFYFTDIEANLTSGFYESDSLYLLIGGEKQSINTGYRSAAAIEHIDYDNNFDLIAGNFSGGLQYFEGSNSPQVAGNLPLKSPGAFIYIYPNPCRDKIYFYIKTNDPTASYFYRIYNPVGQRLLEGKMFANTKKMLNISSLSRGMYYCIFCKTGSDEVISQCRIIVIE
ncbi:MAG: T9SS type A sorting domain-containing protein [Bacteroidales bacterium]|nr:T9SS type A sorting domain-containing protein [Bacteroidales bacterium]MCF8403441.1 T9SS type A sorting domain-containing protein [Bacteroidales bacterium]